MKVTTYPDATSFLAVTRRELEKNEAANSLILSICRRLLEQPDWLEESPYLATVAREQGPVPAAMMTPPHNIVLAPLGEDSAAAVPPLVASLRAGGWQVPGVLAPKEVAQPFAEAWSAAGGAYELHMAQRLYELRGVEIPEGTAPGMLRQGTAADFELVLAWSRAFFEEALGEADLERVRPMVEQRIGAGDFFLWEDGEAVSMAMRTRPAGRGISVTAVYTPPEQRRKGYATACVAALSRQLLASGYEYCTLYTDLANPTSNDIYYQIGYRPVADFDAHRFTD
ncbi:MAG: GNAT family N-acetyltransferase [Anaerolineae bacterium]|nr:GNAT family N-acetyltransferase [Anaerolineae bacterium]